MASPIAVFADLPPRRRPEVKALWFITKGKWPDQLFYGSATSLRQAKEMQASLGKAGRYYKIVKMHFVRTNAGWQKINATIMPDSLMNHQGYIFATPLQAIYSKESNVS